VSQYQKGKTDLDFTEARDSEWKWHQLGQMQVCTSLQTDNHASTPPLSFLQAGWPSCRPTNNYDCLALIIVMMYVCVCSVLALMVNLCCITAGRRRGAELYARTEKPTF